MNRREFLKCAVVALALPVNPNAEAQVVPSVRKEYPFWTKRQLMRLFPQLDGKTTRETVKMGSLIDWNGQILDPHEMIHLAIMRISNIQFRKTMDQESTRWLVMHPNLARVPFWASYQFGTYSTPGKMGGTWTQPGWRHFIKEETAPGVYNVGNLCSRWTMYVCDGIPPNKILLGMGHKKVVHFRRTGKMQQYDWGAYPEMLPYYDKPTHKNFGVITLDFNKVYPDVT